MAVVVVVLAAGLWAWHRVSRPPALPANPCALVPVDLFRTLVPDAGPPNHGHDENTAISRSYCSASTDPDLATTTAMGELRIELDWVGRDAVALFALEKANHAAQDLTGLGDSAYVDVMPRHALTGQWIVEVRVLKPGTHLLVRYEASPTDDTHALSAAVVVARTVLAAL